jgi:hypothetical protein
MNKVFYFLFNLFLEARAEILKEILLFFWSKRGHQNDILILTDRQKKNILIFTQMYKKPEERSQELTLRCRRHP